MLLLPIVAHQVHCKVATGAELLAALLANKLLLVTVLALHVAGQVALIRGSIVALLANVGFLASVHAQVFDQVLLPARNFEASSADVRLLQASVHASAVQVQVVFS